MKPGKIVDKTKGPVKTTGPVVVTTAKKVAKQAKMGHAKKAAIVLMEPCAQGHPTKLVHFMNLRDMRRWCPTCQEVII